MDGRGRWLEGKGACYDEWGEFTLESLVSLDVGEPKTRENVGTEMFHVFFASIKCR